MGYERRKRSELDLYHVMARGSGRQLIFENDADCRRYVLLLRRLSQESPIEILAWCLMGNHVHLLLHGELDAISVFMQDLGRTYALYFNETHDRVGHLFQGRFRSMSIDSEEQLLTVVRYIHLNPVRAGLSTSCRFRWSSFDEYELGIIDGISTTGPVLNLFPGLSEFVAFHEGDEACDLRAPEMSPAYSYTDEEAHDVMKKVLASEGRKDVPLDDKNARNHLLALFKRAGCTVRQIARVTGIGRNIIARA